MPLERDSFIPEEENLMVLPSRIGSKWACVPSESPGETENEITKCLKKEVLLYMECRKEEQSPKYGNHQYNISKNIICPQSKPDPKNSVGHSPASPSSSSPQSSVLSDPHHLSSQQKANPTDLTKCKASSSSLIFSSSPKQFKQPLSVSRNLALQLKPTHLAPHFMSLSEGSSLKLKSELSSSQISLKSTFESDIDAGFKHPRAKINGLSLSLASSSKFNSEIPSSQLSQQSTFISTFDKEIELHNAKTNSSSLSNGTFLKFKSAILSSQISIKPTFKATIDEGINLPGAKTEGKRGEQLDTQLSLGSAKTTMRENPSSRSSSTAASSLNLDTHVSQVITKHARRGHVSGIFKFGISPSQLITPIEYTIEQKLDLLRPQTKSTTEILDAMQREALTLARKESLRRERLLKEHLKRNKSSRRSSWKTYLLNKSTQPEDLLSQRLTTGRFSIRSSETIDFLDKRSTEGSWCENPLKDHTPSTSFMKASAWSEKLRTRDLSSISSRREISMSKHSRRKNLLALQNQNPVAAKSGSITSQEAKTLPFESGAWWGEISPATYSTGIKQKEKVKDGHIKNIPEDLEHSLQLSPPTLQHHRRSAHEWKSCSKPSPDEVNLSLGLKIPSPLPVTDHSWTTTTTSHHN